MITIIIKVNGHTHALTHARTDADEPKTQFLHHLWCNYHQSLLRLIFVSVHEILKKTLQSAATIVSTPSQWGLTDYWCHWLAQCGRLGQPSAGGFQAHYNIVILGECDTPDLVTWLTWLCLIIIIIIIIITISCRWSPWCVGHWQYT